MVKGENRAIFPYCHSYLFNEAILIAFDPQCGHDRLKRALTNLGKKFSDIDFIINTHFHADHTASNSYLKKKSGAKILIHEADRIALENFEEYVKRYGISDKKLETLWRSSLRMIKFKEVSPDQTFKDGDILPGGFKVIHTPGHAPGHCCFYKSEILIAGDIDLKNPWVGNISCNVADYLNSLEKLQKIKFKMLLPSHGQPIFEDIPNRIEAFRQRLLKRENKVFKALPTYNITLDQISNQLFQWHSEKRGKKILTPQDQLEFHFAKITYLNFLKHLELLGKVKKSTIKGQEYWQRIA